jgi:hypothetical protein
MKTVEFPVKYAEIACESVRFGFDGRSRGDY